LVQKIRTKKDQWCYTTTDDDSIRTKVKRMRNKAVREVEKLYTSRLVKTNMSYNDILEEEMDCF